MLLNSSQTAVLQDPTVCRCHVFRAVRHMRPARSSPRLCPIRASSDQVKTAEQSQEAEQPKAAEDEAPQTPMTERTALSGGWVGGETALQQLVEETKQELSEAPAPVKGQPEKKQNGAQSAAPPEEPAAVEAFAPLGGRGGFSGELGVQQFVEKGEVKLSDGRRRQFSPLIVAALIAVGVTSGAILFNNGILFGEHAVEGVEVSLESQLVGGGVDANTRLFLQAALILLTLTGLIAGGRFVVHKVSNTTGRVFLSAGNLGKLGIFWVIVFAAIKFILDS